LVFGAGVGLLAAIEGSSPEVTEIAGLALILVVSGTVGGLFGDLSTRRHPGVAPPPPPARS
jgi:hypothetical protein